MLQETTWNSSLQSYDACEVVDLLFQPERCSVSRALSQILQLVHETLMVSNHLKWISCTVITSFCLFCLCFFYILLSVLCWII